MSDYENEKTFAGMYLNDVYPVAPERKVGESGLSDEQRNQPPWVTAASQDDTFTERPRLDFWGWWRRDGNFYDPDTEDVPWFDKRKFLAEKAFDAGVAQSTNYIADREIYPRQVSFANGRVVSIRWENEEAFLEVTLNEHLLVTGQSASVRKNHIQLTEAKPEPLPNTPQEEPLFKGAAHMIGAILDRIDMAPNDDPLPYIREYVDGLRERHCLAAPNTLQEGILQELIALTKGWTFSDINDATPTSQAVISVTAWDLAKRAEALLAAPKVVDSKEEPDTNIAMTHKELADAFTAYFQPAPPEAEYKSDYQFSKVEEQDGEQDFHTRAANQRAADAEYARSKAESVAPPSLPKVEIQDLPPIRINDQPPIHWKENDGWKRHPQSAEEWNWHNDYDHLDVVPDRSEQRLNFAMDRADPHAPDQMALVLRIDLMRLHGRMISAEAFKELHRRIAAAPVALPAHQLISIDVAGPYATLLCSCGRTFVASSRARARASFEAHLPEKEGK